MARNKKRKLAADIWASNEEVEYELRHNNLDLEEGVDKSKNHNNSTKQKSTTNEYFYIDSFHALQGPFMAHQMQQWHESGYFPPQTQVRYNDGPFQSIATVHFGDEYRVEMDSPQSRIEQLRRAHHRMTDRDKDQVLTPIHAPGQEVDGQEAAAENVDHEDYQFDDDIQARINALRQEHTETSETMHNELKNGDIQDFAKDSDKLCDETKDRQVELQQKQHADTQPRKGQVETFDLEKGNHLSYSPELGFADVKEFRESAVYQVGGFIEPPTYPLEGLAEPPAYPVEDFQELPAYPFEDCQEPAAYPVDNFQESLDYPVEGFQEPPQYQVEDDEAPDVDISQAALHPSTSLSKVGSVDNEIIGLVPSHLQKKRRAVKKTANTTF